MRYQVSVILTDGSKFYLEKININKKDVKEIRDTYKIPKYYNQKAVFVAKLFDEGESKIMYDFLLKNDYIKIFSFSKVNPHMLEDDAVPFSKIAGQDGDKEHWETISLGQINHMFVMGYGLVQTNIELRRKERNYQGTLILLELIDAEKSVDNIDKLQDYLVTKKNIDDISEFANKILNSKHYEIEKYADEFRKLLFPESFINTKSKNYHKIIKIPTKSWQS